MFLQYGDHSCSTAGRFVEAMAGGHDTDHAVVCLQESWESESSSMRHASQCIPQRVEPRSALADT